MSQVAEYLESQVMTAGPHRLHLMVVDGAIRFARRAEAALEASQWEELEAALSRSRDCVTELLGGLDSERSPDLADQLKALFAFVYGNLVLADSQRSAQRIRNALRILEIHRETWTALGEKLVKESTNDSSVPTPHARSWTT